MTDSLPPADADPPFRILIVEDDRSQAVFAQAILRGAGMQAEIILDPTQVMEALDEQQPELLLTDLHMPAMSGTELIERIRQHPRHVQMPVLFLTGDTDPEREMDVLERGGDGYLVKPVSPRHLIAAVAGRVRRARAQRLAIEQLQAAASRHPTTGLHTRAAALEHLGDALAGHRKGSALLLEIGHAGALRNRYGLTGVEQLADEVGRLLAAAELDMPVARLSDHAFLVVAAGLDEAAADALARRLRDLVGGHPFRIEQEPLRLRCNIGMARLRDCAGGVAEVRAALEAACGQAASSASGIALHVPRPVNQGTVELLEDLRAALQDESLSLAFQPVVAVAGETLPQFQVLLRLRDRHGALRSAAEVLPPAADAGLSGQADRAVLDKALALLRQRQHEGRPLRLFVPLAIGTMLEEDFGTWLAARSAGIQPGTLVLESRLEEALVHHAALRGLAAQATASGIGLCLSNYRHGPEAEVLVRELAPRMLKLSPEHAGQPLSEALRAGLQATIALARDSGIKIIGTRLEDPQAAATLWSMGIDFIQGNLVQSAEASPEYDFLHTSL